MSIFKGKLYRSIVLLLVVLSAGLSNMVCAHDDVRLTKAIEQTRDSVVKLMVRKRVPPENNSDKIEPATQESLNKLNQFFKKKFPDMFTSFATKANVVGTGFILNNEGLLVSSAHLIRGATKIKVELASGKTLRAQVVGVDADNDIGLLRMSLNSTTVVPKFVMAKNIKVGQAVYAIGAPFGFTASVASGIISAIRTQSSFSQKTTLIQTDVAINPGNSGGPIFNFEGEVIGITTQIMSTNGGAQGVSFAVSMENVMKSVNTILQQEDL